MRQILTGGLKKPSSILKHSKVVLYVNLLCNPFNHQRLQSEPVGIDSVGYVFLLKLSILKPKGRVGGPDPMATRAE